MQIMVMLKKYAQFITGATLGSIIGGVLTGVIAGSTALANIKENRNDILECKENVNKCREHHELISSALNDISHDGQRIEDKLDIMIRGLGREHTIPEHK